jgi:cephalosporin hydroxylase
MPSITTLLTRVGRFLARMRAIRGTRGVADPDRLLAFFKPPSLGAIFEPLQKRAEIRDLFLRVRDLRPRTVLEIGTNYGGTLLLFCRAAAPDATLISLDLPGGRFGGGYPLSRVPYYRAFASRGQRLRLLRCDSHDPGTVAAVQRLLRGRPLDFLFIDGDHSYLGVKQDFQVFAPLVRAGGLIALHDVVPAPQEIGGEVPRFWAEVKARQATEELIEHPDQQMMGIGLLRVPPGGVAL